MTGVERDIEVEVGGMGEIGRRPNDLGLVLRDDWSLSVCLDKGQGVEGHHDAYLCDSTLGFWTRAEERNP